MSAVRARSELRELESLTARREFEAVVELGRPLLSKHLTDRDLALVRSYLGQALCRLVHPLEALAFLPLARERFELQNEEWLAVDALDWEASARGLLEGPTALTLGGEALARGREPGAPAGPAGGG